MKYTKPWLIENSVSEDDWHTWLSARAVIQQDYQLLYGNHTVIVEFFDQDLAQAFVLEFGL